jgi:trans-aconitate 2-methyltransferase
MTEWDTQRYLDFSAQRLQPGLDLLARITVPAPALIYDLGCGTGQLTKFIAERWPVAQVIGLDSSATMLARVPEHPGIRWMEADISDWNPPQKADLLFSNAALHWLDAHPTLFPQLLEGLKEGGCLGIQMPLNHQAPSHRLMSEVLDASRLGSDALRQRMARRPVMAPEAYYDLLCPLVKTLDIWTTEYLHILDGEDAVLDWVSSTALRPILKQLNGQELKLFLAEYTQRLRIAYPRQSDGKTLFPFRRLFIHATV